MSLSDLDLLFRERMQVLGMTGIASVGVAVSGGGDSMALLDLAMRHGPAAGVAVHAVTLDHGLRPEAAAEAAAVAAFCAGQGLEHRILSWRGTSVRGNLQAEARAARYRMIGEWARAEGIPEVMLGHTRDDVAETFLIRLGRKSGLDGLSHMAPHFHREGLRWTRPLLLHSRAELREHLLARGVAWIEDPSNTDERYARVRARQALAALEPLGITAAGIAESAWMLRQAREVVDTRTAEAWAGLVRAQAGDLLLGFTHPADEVERRLLVLALQRVGDADWPARRGGLIEMLASLPEQGYRSLGGCLIRQEATGLRIAREWQALRDHAVPVDGLWDGRWRLHGPAQPGQVIRALGQGIALCPDWRASGLPRASLMAGPAVWQDGMLVAAPLAGFGGDWTAELRPGFGSFPHSH